MIRKLLWAWLVLGTLLMAAGIAHGQVTYQRGPILPWSQRFSAGSQGMQGGCQVGPGGRMICGPGGCSSCQGGSCTLPGSSGGGWQPAASPPPPTFKQTPGRGTTPPAQGGARARTPSPVVVPTRWRAVVRVMCEDGGGVRSWGSGVLIGVHPTDDFAAVLTCSHTFRDRQGGVFVYFPDGTGYQAIVRAHAPKQDLALLWIKKPRNGVVPIPLAQRDPGPGDALFSMGYQDAKAWQSHVARFTKLYQDGWYGITTGGGNGFSGGPVIDADSRVAGIRWAQDASSEAMASPPSLIRRLFADSWLFEQGHDAATETPDAPVGPGTSPPATSPPSAAVSIPAALGSCEGLGELRAELLAAIVEIQTGKQGLPGKDGETGPQGLPGKPADSKVLSDLAARVSALETKIDQPITFQTIDAITGNVIEESQTRLGQTQRLILVPIPQK